MRQLSRVTGGWPNPYPITLNLKCQQIYFHDNRVTILKWIAISEHSYFSIISYKSQLIATPLESWQANAAKLSFLILDKIVASVWPMCLVRNYDASKGHRVQGDQIFVFFSSIFYWNIESSNICPWFLRSGFGKLSQL